MIVENKLEQFLALINVSFVNAEKNKVNLQQDLQFPCVLLYPIKKKGTIQDTSFFVENQTITIDVMYRYGNGIDFMNLENLELTEKADKLAKLIVAFLANEFEVSDYSITPFERFNYTDYIVCGVRLVISVPNITESLCNYILNNGAVSAEILQFI